MASSSSSSLHFCNPVGCSNLFQKQSKLPQVTMVASSPSKLIKSSTVKCNLEMKAALSNAKVVHRVDKSIEHSATSSSSNALKIGIIGLGAFGQFLANAFQRQGHDVLATSRSDYSQYCQENGIEYFRELNDLCEAQPDVVLVCSSILSTEDVVRRIPFHKLKSTTIIADVLSVKQFPKNLLLDVVPPDFGILCTHPMFGKFSGKNSWEGLRFVYDKVRISKNSIQEQKCEQFLDIFQDEGCRMIEMSCEEHDKYAAESQFITHTVSRILSNMDLQPTPIDTKGFETLMELTRNTVSHGSDLYDGLFLYNVNAAKQIEKLEMAFDTVKRNLFGKLRETMRREMEESVEPDQILVQPQVPQFLPSSEKVLKDVSSFSMLPEEGSQNSSLQHQREVYHATQ